MLSLFPMRLRPATFTAVRHRAHHRRLPTNLPAVAVVLLVASSLPAAAQIQCDLRQVTETEGNLVVNQNVSMDGAGSLVSWESNGGGGPIHTWTYEPATGVAQPRSTGALFTGNNRPSTSLDGSIVVFVNENDLTGGNPDFSQEVFLWDRQTDQIEQVTDLTAPASAGNAFPLPTGQGVVFTSASDQLGVNDDGFSELYLWNRGSGVTTRLTDTEQGSSTPVVSREGSLLAFVSRADFLGGNADGNEEIFLMDLGSATVVQQITSTTGCDSYPSLYNQSFTEGAGQLLLDSNCPLDGGLDDGLYQGYLYDFSDDSFERVTGDPVGEAFAFSVSGDGRWVGLVTAKDLAGDNADGSFEGFLLDRDTDTFHQVTSSLVNSSGPVVNAAGTAWALAGRIDPFGTNTDESLEIFYCAAPSVPVVEVPIGGPWSHLALALLLVVAAAGVFSRQSFH